jgi:hypothetical protein
VSEEDTLSVSATLLLPTAVDKHVVIIIIIAALLSRTMQQNQFLP